MNRISIVFVFGMTLMILGSVAALLDDTHPAWTIVWAACIFGEAIIFPYFGVLLARQRKS